MMIHLKRSCEGVGGLLAVVLCLLVWTASAEGRSLFEVFAASDDGTIQAEGEGSSLADLVEDLIRSRGDFTALTAQDFNASLNYGGVEDALTFEVFQDGNEWVVILRSELTGLDEEFRGFSRAAAEDELEDWLKKDGASAYARFQAEIQKRSLVGVLDGNPNATTALLAQQTFRRFGMARPMPSWFTRGQGLDEDGMDPNPEGGWWFRVVGLGNFASAGDFSVDGGGVAFDTGTWLTENLGLSLGSMLMFMDVSGAAVVHGGTEFGVPVRVMNRRALNDAGSLTLTWQVTPVFNVAGAGSADMVAGGLIWGVGGSNQLVLGVGDLDITLGTQLTHYEGIRLRAGDYEFKPDLNQQVLMNGVVVTYPIAEAFFVDGGVSYTRYLSSAAVRDWISPTVGLGMRLGNRGILNANYTGSFGENSYRNHQVMVGLNMPF
ncbi:hypothetical protein ACERK3_00685 [Phycisphaerales bacterium AB-hyl4]|uniref:Uncharacterized protein n=1 Tax=Natronomicrosphaera hydrolytica TaxID=3242702 RepID=A0ABV4TZU8_9BACT